LRHVFLAMRRLGGSDIAKLLGISPYGGPLEVYERIVLGVEAEWNPRMERGTMFEPVLRALGQRILGIEVEDAESDYWDHPEWEFARAQIDDVARWNGLRVAVDYKTVSRFAKGWGPDGTDVVPAHIHAQMAWELSCCDRELGLLVAGFGDDVPAPEVFNMSHVLTYQVQRDPLFESHLRAVAKEFWETHVLPCVPPNKTTGKRKRKS
jgi:predicted phage-related endonuclease